MTRDDEARPGSSSGSPTRSRPRAPTITIDTTNLAPAPEPLPPAIVTQSHLISRRPSWSSTSTIDNPYEGEQNISPLTANNSGTLPSSHRHDSSVGFLSVPTEPYHHHHSSDTGDQVRSVSMSSNGSSNAWTVVTSKGSPSDEGDHKLDFKELLKCENGEDDTKDEDGVSPFAFNIKQLQKLHDPKNLDILRAMGGLEGLCIGLRTDETDGLSIDEGSLNGQITHEEVWRAVERKNKSPGDDSSSKDSEDKVVDLPVEEPLQSTDRKQTLETIDNSISVGSLPKRPTLLSRSPDTPQEFESRKQWFSANVIPARKPKNIFQLMWMALHDKILILLSVAAVVSLALGLYQTFRKRGPEEPKEPQVEWVEGVAIIVAIAIVTIVQSLNDWQKERQFVKLNKKKEDREVKAIRSGKTTLVNIYDVVVGDVLHLEPGDLIPVDGVLIQGHNIKCDESAATGESDALSKLPAGVCISATEPGSSFNRKFDPFILSGSKALEGIGTYVVTAVGPNSYHGRTMMSLREDPEDTPLQLKLNRVANMIAKLGGASALLLFIILLIRFLAHLPYNTSSAAQKGQQFMQILIVSVTIVVVAVPEGLPLAVTLALAYATTRMLKDNNLVRVLKACETMGNATTICSDKTGTLTQNRMTVIAGTLGISARFERDRQFAPSINEESHLDQAYQNKSDKKDDLENTPLTQEDPEIIPMHNFLKYLPVEVKDMLLDSMAINSTAFEGTDEAGRKSFVGSKTETALLEMAETYLGMDDINTLRSDSKQIQPFPFSSENKSMGIVLKVHSGTNEIYRLYIKGASEILLKHSSHTIDNPKSESIDVRPLSKEDRELIEKTIVEYASKSLRTIGLVYRDFSSWPPKGARPIGEDRTQVEYNDVFKDMTYLGVVGIMDPLRPGVTKAVADCRNAGVFVRMVTGDNTVTAKAIASECGIFTPGGIVMDGPRFRTLSSSQMNSIIPRLQVLARSSPEDKRILVKRLKELGEIVAVTGDGTNDGPALKTADVGFSMGIAGTEVAKEASSIVLMDDNFASIVKAIMWGRSVNDSVKKFLQFQLTVNITAVLLAFVSAVASNDETSALTAVQLLWVNLIMDTFAALALATDPPTPALLNRKPEPKGASIISFEMWKMIFGQAIFQTVVTFVLHFAGQSIFRNWNSDQIGTVVFNTFVWMQIFNEINCRRLDSKLNVLEGVHRNYFFIAITVIMVGGQILIVFVGGQAFSVVRPPINGAMWAVCIVLGALSIPAGAIIRLIPNDFVRIFIPHRILERRKRKAVIYDQERGEEWNQAIEDVRDDLLFIKNLRSKRRLGNLGDTGKAKAAMRRLIPGSNSPRPASPSLSRRPSTPSGLTDPSVPSPSPSPVSTTRRQRSKSNSAFNAATMVPALVATSMMWTPQSPSEVKPFDQLPVTLSREDLEKVEGVELHAGTDPSDPVIGSPADQYSPLEANRPKSPMEEGSQRGHWRGRLSLHARGSSRSSVTSANFLGAEANVPALQTPKRDLSRDSRDSSRKSQTDMPTEEIGEGSGNATISKGKSKE